MATIDYVTQVAELASAALVDAYGGNYYVAVAETQMEHTQKERGTETYTYT